MKVSRVEGGASNNKAKPTTVGVSRRNRVEVQACQPVQIAQKLWDMIGLPEYNVSIIILTSIANLYKKYYY